jgi:hypothetical protein
MSESGLSIGFADLQQEVGWFLGYGRTSGNWSASQEAEIDIYVQSGVRRVYYPPAIQGVTADMIGYEWSWLRPTTTLAITSGTSDYDLPDDLGRVMSAFYYPAAEYLPPIQQVSIGRILALRAASDLTGKPYYFATRFLAEDRTSGSRQEVLFFPEPDDSWVLSYEYEAYSGQLSDSYPYPLGGMKLSELFIESCLAVAESRTEEVSGIHTQQFQLLLVDAIQRDKKSGTTNFGQMGDTTETPTEFRRGYSGSVYGIVYKGESV